MDHKTQSPGRCIRFVVPALAGLRRGRKHSPTASRPNRGRAATSRQGAWPARRLRQRVTSRCVATALETREARAGTTSVSLARTAAAIKAYDEQSKKFDTLFDAPKLRNEDVEKEWLALEEKAKAVGHAFGLDTAHTNNMETCERCVRPDAWLRKKVADWENSLASSKKARLAK